MGVDHVEVAFVDDHIDGLAHRPAGMMDGRRKVGELHEVLEVGERAITSAAGAVIDEGRSVSRCEDDVIAADLDGAGRVTGMLGEPLRCGAAKRCDQPRVEANALAVNFGAGLTKQCQCVGIATNIHADFRQNAVGGLFDPNELRLVEEGVDWNLSGEIGGPGSSRTRLSLEPLLAPTALAAGFCIRRRHRASAHPSDA